MAAPAYRPHWGKRGGDYKTPIKNSITRLWRPRPPMDPPISPRRYGAGNYTSSSSGTLATTGTTAQDQYLFWDHLHPTETGHQAIAALAEQDLSGDATEQITQFYNNILQRAPDAAGLAYWETAASGTLTLQQVDYGIATSSEKPF